MQYDPELIYLSKKLKNYMVQFMDHRNYATYSKFSGKKFVRPARTKKQIVRYENKGRTSICKPRNYEWTEHLLLKDQFRLGYVNNPYNNVWLIMLDYDTDKNDVNRKENLKESIKITKKLLGVNVYTEDSTFSDDKHGYILVCIDRPISKAKRLLLDFGKYCSNIMPIKKFEVMGLPATYVWLNKKIVKVEKSGIIAKVPRTLDSRKFKKLKKTGMIKLSLIEKLINQNETGISKKGGEEGGYIALNNPKLTNKLPNLTSVNKTSLTEDNSQKLSELWDLATTQSKMPVRTFTQTVNNKTYTKNVYITKQQFTDYATAWMLCITNYDKHVKGRKSIHQSTVSYKKVNERYESIAGRKADDVLRAWVMQQLVEWQVIILRNPNYDYHQHISRKFAFSWDKLKELTRESFELNFVDNKQNLKIT